MTGLHVRKYPSILNFISSHRLYREVYGRCPQGLPAAWQEISIFTQIDFKNHFLQMMGEAIINIVPKMHTSGGYQGHVMHTHVQYSMHTQQTLTFTD